MKGKVELPIVEPIYSSYQYQGSGGAIIQSNPSIRNWYLNETIALKCDRVFLFGYYSSPLLKIPNSSLWDNPYFERIKYPFVFANGYINFIIREMIDNGYYVYFDGPDDYYIKGKSFYKKRHLNHDGLIFGYDRYKKAYNIYCYNENWVYKKFEISQKDFDLSRKQMLKDNYNGYICGIKAKQEVVEIKPDIVLEKLKEYLNSDMKMYPKSEQGKVYGIVVHDYIAMYVDMLSKGEIAYERMDWRIFRIIWEHKKAMLERLEKMEEALKLDSTSSTAYKQLVAEADKMRMLYASHHMRRRDSVLPIIRDKLIELKKNEQLILKSFIKKAEGVIKQ